jgi:membrane fusion protein (multidrug efflux system)
MNETAQNKRRRPTILAILALALLAGATGAAWYQLYGRWYETTDNAYVTGNLVEVNAQIGGSVVWIGPEENQVVTQGQAILLLDDGDARALLELRRQQLALAVREVLTLRAEVDRLGAEQRLRAVTHQLARDEFRRRQQLFPQNMVSREELDAARTREAETRVALETARLALAKARVRAGSQPIADHPEVMAAASQLRTAFRDWRKTRIIAPVDGEIARRRVQAGQRVTTGSPLFSIAQRDSAWIEANFKETQLRHIRPGQPVAIRSDLYGKDVTLEGRVESIGVGTGAVFSLLPPQNATGNWIKIVQRVPVRIGLTQGFDRTHPLPFGASLHVRVDTHDRSGPPLTVEREGEPVAEANIYGYQDEGAEAMIAGIIAANAAPDQAE